MKQFAKTLLLVVVLTAVIWAWAEESQTRSLDKQTIELRIDLPARTGFALRDQSTARQWGHTLKIKIAVDFNGQQGGISRLSQMIARGEFSPTFQPRIDERLRNYDGDGVETISVNLASVLSDQPILDRLHAVVTSVSPATVEIQVARLKEYRLSIVPPEMSGGRSVLKDTEATVMLPAPLYNSLHSARPRKDVLRARVISSAGQDSEQAAEIVREIDGYPISPAPARTTITRDLTVQDLRFENVPVQPVFPPGFWPFGQYYLVSDQFQWRKTVVVRGPAGRLTLADVRVQLVFESTDTNPTVGLSRNVEVVLPPDFKLVKVEPTPSIDFRFKLRSDPGGP